MGYRRLFISMMASWRVENFTKGSDDEYQLCGSPRLEAVNIAHFWLLILENDMTTANH